MNEMFRVMLDHWSIVFVCAIGFLCGWFFVAYLRRWSDDADREFKRKNELRIDEEYKRLAFADKPKRKIMLSDDGELLEVISDEVRSSVLHEGFHDESPYETPNPDEAVRND